MDEGDILFFRIQIHLIRRKIMTIYDELVARGLIAQVTDEKEIKELINNGKATFYIGFDPTADSLHVGHFMALCLMKRLQMAGNKPIVLIGGGTAQIGDPSGRTDMRQMMTSETINHNVECFKKQMSRFIDFGEGKKNIYALEGTEVLVQRNREVQMAAHDFGKGRAVYISGVPYSFANSRTLYRAILWSAHSEEELHTWFSSNYNVEVHAYVKNGKYCVVNNTYEPQYTSVYTTDGNHFALHLEANEIKWYEI